MALVLCLTLVCQAAHLPPRLAMYVKSLQVENVHQCRWCTTVLPC